ncbi:glycoside hydrolase family 16 protein [Piloderma croceum F 1598]|uniref:Glycoside hydrolase family 16 protein n=1 Tax=Piloderma croceum (strain F 1598) TaxID=765440 RepID=A0A0C3BED8_PILCF|nr:glycoside hydrolase family 16 protein [Piloderma croceum F 1598]
MYFHIHLVVIFFCSQIVPTTIAKSYSSHSITERLHNVALKHSAGLASDLRVALGGVLLTRRQQPTNSGLQNRAVYCVSQQSSKNNGGAQVPLSGGGNGTTTTIRPSGTSGSGGTATSTTGGSTPSSTSSWTLAEAHQGSSFFDGWDFFTGSDPTHGDAIFINQSTANSLNLAQINGQGNAVMAVETTPQVAGTRQSVRITTQSQFNGGLFIMDAVHMPTGCATWPAFWTNGPNWPTNGEIDIIEGVNNYTNNQATIHTNPGCSLASSSSSALAITGTVVGGTDCSAADSGNQGCGMRSPANNSFGTGFNDIGGGVYAMQWDDSGIAVFFFPRGSVPSDINAGSPDPSGWGTPMARWPAASCNPFQFFKQHSVIFDITLCGDWAGSVWSSSGIPGQEQSCAQLTGFSTCDAFAQANGASFSEAYWEVSSVKIYQQSS